jgi:hypothetical protein
MVNTVKFQDHGKTARKTLSLEDYFIVILT